ncbi:diol dehydratase small subunit [Thermosediminibacter litoriperuensis]|uniref:Propanediol dehydratase small subunit n=1 Tax=Thermosediminibacter litoriperuensis TaxID=291989 RepID=A0A5S5AT71_9FIRM|nr:diol dehydratase small subunit [Thermosediminibacter litoriperuensis]TYP55469.1 propanediol dehydratase small subunit [Thermosediminibacter litoriperuensis]
MIDEKALEEIVRQVLEELGGHKKQAKAETKRDEGLDPKRDFPLSKKRPELLKSATGKNFSSITLEEALKGNIKAEDFRISSETLLMQAEIAEKVGRKQFANNLRRAAELSRVPDERILEIYNALRPYRSTKEELLAIADDLQNKYNAPTCAAFVREAAEVYERRRRLKGME